MANIVQSPKPKNGWLKIAVTLDNPQNKKILEKDYQYADGVKMDKIDNKNKIYFNININKIKDASGFVKPLIDRMRELGENFDDEQKADSMQSDNTSYMKNFMAVNKHLRKHIGEIMQKLIKGEDQNKLLSLIVGKLPRKSGISELSYSNGNAIFILSQDEDATYVDTEERWYKIFNRVVTDKSKPIYVKVNRDGGIDEDAINKIMSINYSDKDAATRSRRTANRMAANPKTNDEEKYYKVAYDVRFTKVIPNERDVFSETPGLLSNVYGIPNKKALQIKNSGTTSYQKSDDDYTQIFYQNRDDIIKNRLKLIDNVNKFMAKNREMDLANAKDFKEVIENVIEYQLRRNGAYKNPTQIISDRTDIVVREEAREILRYFLTKAFNVWKGKYEVNDLSGIDFSNISKSQLYLIFWALNQSGKIILGQGFGLQRLTSESNEIDTTNQQMDINLPSFSEFVHELGISDEEYKQLPNSFTDLQNKNKQQNNINNNKQDNMNTEINKNQEQEKQQQLQQQQNEEAQKQLKLIKEEFNNFFNRMNNVKL